MRANFYKVHNGYGDSDDIFVKSGEDNTFTISVPRVISDDITEWLNKAYEIGTSEGNRAAYQTIVKEVEARHKVDVIDHNELFKSRVD